MNETPKNNLHGQQLTKPCMDINLATKKRCKYSDAREHNRRYSHTNEKLEDLH